MRRGVARCTFHAMERLLKDGLAPFECAFEHAAIGMAIVGADGRLLKVNRALCETFGYSADELLDVGRELFYPDGAGEDRPRLEGMISGVTRSYRTERRCSRKDGGEVWVLLHVSLARDGDGEPLYFIIQAQDVTERKTLEGRLAHLAYHDALTGLPNRVLLEERMERAIARSDRNDTHLAVLYLDLDDFKRINDAWGHAAGDEVLVGVAERLRTGFRVTDTVARIGGDEFCVLLEGIGRPSEVLEMAERARALLREPLAVGRGEVSMHASTGVAVRPPGGVSSVSRLLCEADADMYRAKKSDVRDAVGTSSAL